jgi:hypothetical protein
MSDINKNILCEFECLFQNLIENCVDVIDLHSGHVTKDLAKKWFKDLSHKSEELMNDTKCRFDALFKPTLSSTQKAKIDSNESCDDVQVISNSENSASGSKSMVNFDDNNTSMAKLNDRMSKIEDMMNKVLKFSSKQMTSNNYNYNVRQKVDRKPICHNCSKSGHISRNCSAQRKICRKCNKRGHIEKYCRNQFQINMNKNNYRQQQNSTDINDGNIKWSDMNMLKNFLWAGLQPPQVPMNPIRPFQQYPHPGQAFPSQTYHQSN